MFARECWRESATSGVFTMAIGEDYGCNPRDLVISSGLSLEKISQRTSSHNLSLFMRKLAC